jgi:hypothetical protein
VSAGGLIIGGLIAPFQTASEGAATLVPFKRNLNMGSLCWAQSYEMELLIPRRREAATVYLIEKQPQTCHISTVADRKLVR